MKQLCLFINILIFNFLLGQKSTLVYPPHLDSLLLYENLIIEGKNDFIKLQSNEYFFRLISEILSYPDAYRYDFDTLKILYTLRGDDFLIITWGVSLSTGKTIPYGFTLKKLSKDDTYRLTELKNIKDSLSDPERAILKNGDWWGAIYYQIIPLEINNIKCYTLLGWDGENELYQSKLIDVLSFSYNGLPIFGKRIFRNIPDKKNPTRLIFRYSDEAVMTLRYEKQSYEINTVKIKKRNKPNRSRNFKKAQKRDKKIVKTKRYNRNMIVFNTLSPLNKFLDEQYQYYFPNAEDLVGLELIDNRWVYRTNIDARNAPDDQDNYNPEKRIHKNKIPKY
ncbi:MAG: hypothetical protein PHD90_03020 [Bacteroidales bacterium]|nr:hypothetical protein [Bacteroidales bacterium]